MNILQRFAEKRKNRENGIYNGAPLFLSFPYLGQSIPSIDKGAQIMTVGGTGSGKSQSWMGLGLIPIYDMIKKVNYKAHFYIVLLEDSYEMFEERLFSACLYRISEGKFSIPPKVLNSKTESLTPKEALAYFPKAYAMLNDILKYCTVYTSLYSATSVYNQLKTEASKYGTHVYKERINDDTGNPESTDEYERYESKDDVHRIVFLDNLNNFADEYDSKLRKALDLRGVITKWTRDYSRLHIVKHWNWTVWNIMQAALETEKKEFNKMGGESIVEKLLPSLASLGDNKTCARDHHLIIGLFSPARFGIPELIGYDTNRLGDNFRAITILKSNDSTPNEMIPMWFNGACSTYADLPWPMTEKDYIKYCINERRA